MKDSIYQTRVVISESGINVLTYLFGGLEGNIIVLHTCYPQLYMLENSNFPQVLKPNLQTTSNEFELTGAALHKQWQTEEATEIILQSLREELKHIFDRMLAVQKHASSPI